MNRMMRWTRNVLPRWQLRMMVVSLLMVAITDESDARSRRHRRFAKVSNRGRVIRDRTFFEKSELRTVDFRGMADVSPAAVAEKTEHGSGVTGPSRAVASAHADHKTLASLATVASVTQSAQVQRNSLKFFVGVAQSVGPSMLIGFSGLVPGLKTSIVVGLLQGNHEVAFQFSPMTDLTILEADPSFSCSAVWGYWLRLTDKLDWPMRFGAGTTYLSSKVLGYSLDLEPIGLAYRHNHFLMSLSLPAIQVIGGEEFGAIVSWHFRTSISYVF